MPEPSSSVEIIRGGFSLLGALVGGSFVLVGGWWADRRRQLMEVATEYQKEKAILTGAFSVTNFINKRLNRWDEDGLRSHLLELKIAQVYVEKLIERSPSGSERIMVAVLDLGLQLDALMGKIEHLPESNVLGEMEAYANSVTSLVRDLAQPLEMLEILITGELPMLDDDDLAKLGIKSLD